MLPLAWGAAVLALLTVGLVACARTPGRDRAGAESAVAYCQRVDTDDQLRPVPTALVPAFRRAFALQHAPVEYVEHDSYIRCAHGVVLGCTVGANLPCGPADTRRDIPGADVWCRKNGDPAVIPAYVTGHASIYAWRCETGRAVPVRRVARADDRGFVARYWRRVAP